MLLGSNHDENQNLVEVFVGKLLSATKASAAAAAAVAIVAMNLYKLQQLWLLEQLLSLHLHGITYAANSDVLQEHGVVTFGCKGLGSSTRLAIDP